MKFILHLNTVKYNCRQTWNCHTLSSIMHKLRHLIWWFFFKIVNVLAGTYILTNDTVIYVSGSSVRSILFRNIHISV